MMSLICLVTSFSLLFVCTKLHKKMKDAIKILESQNVSSTEENVDPYAENATIKGGFEAPE